MVILRPHREDTPKSEIKNALGNFKLKFCIIYVIIKIKAGEIMEQILEDFHLGKITWNEMIDKLYIAFYKIIIETVERRRKLEFNTNE